MPFLINNLYIKINKILFKVPQTSDIKRAFLSASCTGSLSIEAVIVIPLLIFFILIFSSPLFIMDTELTLREKMLETVLKMSEFFYVDDILTDTKFAEQNSSLVTLASDGVSLAYAYNKLLTGETKEYFDNSIIIDDSSDISIKLSTVSTEENIIDIIADYKTSMKLPLSMPSLHLVQCCFVKGFCGVPIKKSDFNPVTVYITKYGSVYHQSTGCPYLYGANEVEVSPFQFDIMSDIEYLGITYSCCHLCPAKDGWNYDYIYLIIGTDTYHYTLECPTFKRTIYAVHLSDISEDYFPCMGCY